MDITKVKVWDKVLKSFYELKAIYFDNDMVGIKIGNEVDGEWTVIKKEHVEFIKPTGLTDRNGVEIYEGDIVDYGADYSVVRYQDGCFWSRLGQYQLYNHNKNDIEVIGNIYENSDLLATT